MKLKLLPVLLMLMLAATPLQAKNLYVACSSSGSVTQLFTVGGDALRNKKYGDNSYQFVADWEREWSKGIKPMSPSSWTQDDMVGNFKSMAFETRDDRFSDCRVATDKDLLIRWISGQIAQGELETRELRYWRPYPQSYIKAEPWPNK